MIEDCEDVIRILEAKHLLEKKKEASSFLFLEK